MNQQKLEIEDNSADKEFFTIIPNYILNHSSALDQALYLQLKRLAGDRKSNYCYPSFRYLKKQLKVGEVSLKKSFQYLVANKWIDVLGKKREYTKGGQQWVSAYKINDIWKLNMDYYRGVSNQIHPEETKVSPEITKVYPETGKVSPVIGAKERTIKEEPLKKDTTTKVVANATPASYGNEDINVLMDFLKEKLGGSPDGTVKENRRFAYLLLGRVKKDYPGQKPVEIIQQVLLVALKDTFHAQNTTSFKYLYYNFQKIVQSAKGQFLNPKYIKL